MAIFCAVDDDRLIRSIKSAKHRVVFIAPGIHAPVAEALGHRFREIGERLNVTVILDPDDDVCRIGYGDKEGLARLHALAQEQMIGLKAQSGLRIGVLMTDDEVLVWSPTPRSVEAPPRETTTPNGLVIGADPVAQLVAAVAPEGTNTDPSHAEIGRAAVTPDDIRATMEALEKNPPIPVNLARITRVFSTKLQFVEIEVKRAKLSQSKLKVSDELLNADVPDELRGMIQSRLRAFAELRHESVEVPSFTHGGEPAFDQHGHHRTEPVSEAKLESVRRDIERDFVYDISGYGRLIEKDRKSEFQKRMNAYEQQLRTHALGIRRLIDEQAKQILDDAVSLVLERSARGIGGERPDPKALREELAKGLERAKADAPSLSIRFKDVTYEQTQSKDFHALVGRALPQHAKKRLGEWTHQFEAAAKSTTTDAIGSKRNGTGG